MLVKRFLLVAFLATASMQSMADINSLVADYGVQNARLDEAGLQELLTILGSAGSFDTDPTALAASSVLRAQLTADGDTTLAGLGRGESAFNNLFTNSQHQRVRNEFNRLLTSNDSTTRAAAIAEIKAAMVEPASAPAVLSGADAVRAKFLANGIDLSQPNALMSSVNNDAITAADMTEAINLGLANIATIGNDGNQNALHWTAAFGKPDKMDALLSASNAADISTALSTVDTNGRTPTELANNNSEVIGMFKKHGINA